MTDHKDTIATLVTDYLTIEAEISDQKNEQRSIRRAINALGGLDDLNERKAAFKKDVPKPSK